MNESKFNANSAIGSRRAWLTLVSLTRSRKGNRCKCVVDCDCGQRLIIGLARLKSMSSCGCVQAGKCGDKLATVAIKSLKPCCKDEQWKWAVGFENYALVSTCGRVFSLHLRKILQGYPHVFGYPTVNLNRQLRRRPRSVHSLVLTAFRGRAPEGLQARHLDGNETNNHLSNLLWGTFQDNTEDKRRHGTIPLGEAHHSAVLTESLVRTIRSEQAAGARAVDIARKFTLKVNTVRSVLSRQNWSHVT